ncbi:uncharacterized protein [Clytia hemisphaerica]|uniref:uncharacterized protein n=1 Tax=Clytia hemisphaerica TaxID=252671 RepID=UPI0034D4BD25
MKILPNKTCLDALKKDFIILFARSVVSFLPGFAMFKKFVPKHIKHQFTKEMTQKSEVVPLGLIFKCEQTTSEMAEILKEIQEKYVPLKQTEEGVEVKEKVPFGGDQMSAARTVSAQKAFLVGNSQYKRLEGLSPKFEDWHLKKTFYEIKDALFRKHNSGKDFGTVTWSMNVLNTSNAKQGPHANYNAYQDFSDKETDYGTLSDGKFRR